MRKPLPDGSIPDGDAADAPAGGRAMQRARQFAQQRGLPVPATPPTSTVAPAAKKKRSPPRKRP